MEQNTDFSSATAEYAWYDIPHLQKYRTEHTELPARLKLLSRFRPALLSTVPSETPVVMSAETPDGMPAAAPAAQTGTPASAAATAVSDATPFAAANAAQFSATTPAASSSATVGGEIASTDSPAASTDAPDTPDAVAAAGDFFAAGETTHLPIPDPNHTFDLIDNFLENGDHKISIAETTSDEFTAPSELLPQGSLLTEELALVYEKQRLYKHAIKIYRELSLLNPEKSVYFAEHIADLELRSAAESTKTDSK